MDAGYESSQVRIDLIDRGINELIDGNDEERLGALARLQTMDAVDKQEFADRLRTTITKRFNPRVHESIETASRDPNRIPSIRAWLLSALIRVDAEGFESQSLLLQHVQSEFEAERLVRFWVLAGLYEDGASCLNEAVSDAVFDEAPEVSALAQIIASPDDSDVVDSFRSRLHSSDTWSILRVLRVVAIPELADDVCALLQQSEEGSHSAYDSLYALSSKEMARASALILAKNPGVEATVRRVISECRTSDNNAVRHFSVLLEEFDRGDVQRVMADVMQDSEMRSGAERMQRYLASDDASEQSEESALRWIQVSDSPELKIPDGDPHGIESTLAVEDAGLVNVLEVNVAVEHTWIGDLEVTLVHPDGTSTLLLNSDDEYSSNLDLALKSDQHSALQVFRERSARGSWTLRVTDVVGVQKQGTFKSWALRLGVTGPPSTTRHLNGLLRLSNAPRPSRFIAETFDGEDFLEIRGHVNAFASLMASKELKPPLSIGLFGDWGSGKTFFMKRIQKRIEWLAERSADENSETPFHQRIVQIEFNAWHYVESNLWASLVEHIFQNLRISGDGEKDVQERRDFLLEKIDATLIEKRAAEEDVRDALKNRDAAHRLLESERERIEDLRGQLEQEQRKELWRELKVDELRNCLVPVFEKLGIKRTVQAGSELRSALDELGSLSQRGRVLWTWVVQGQGKTSRLLWLLAAVVVVPLLGLSIPFLLQKLNLDAPAFNDVSSIILQIGTFVGAVAAWLIKQVNAADGILKNIDDAQEKYDTALSGAETKRLKTLSALETSLAAQHTTLKRSRETVKTCQTELEKAREALANLTAEARLARFIDERVASDDYREQLGILAMVRRDFETLSHLMNLEEDPVPAGCGISPLEKNDSHRIDRIILYIDDLDRCPPDKVVQVLQAVHLLLAFPLFVVVVGVDARWVSRSLYHKYKDLWKAPDAVGDMDPGDAFPQPASAPVADFGVHDESALLIPGHAARPSDYLEKLFQIPFWLRPMGNAATSKYITGLVSDVEATEAPGGKTNKALQENPAEAGTGSFTSSDKRATEDSTSAGTDDPGPPSGKQEKSPMDEKRRPGPKNDELEMQERNRRENADEKNSNENEMEQRRRNEDEEALAPKNLVLRDVELEFMQSLASLVGRSPRAVKRFVNVYRLIRSGIAANRIDDFAGTRRAPGPFRIAMLLLGAVVGVPVTAQILLQLLQRASPEESLAHHVSTTLFTTTPIGADEEHWQDIIKKLQDVADQNGDLEMIEVQEYADEISRYSFVTGNS